MSPGSLRGVLSSGLRSLGGLSYEDLLANGQAVVGSPPAVADRLADLYEKLGGFGQPIGLFAIGPSTHEQVMRSAELFGADVMPALRPLGVATERTTT
jgi:alkanesulfonate monooxygenase SsuD/methylene tetrahydromethanopterin reductase-like flavin-dependent oxidoreductase (luciferase family)